MLRIQTRRLGLLFGCLLISCSSMAAAQPIPGFQRVEDRTFRSKHDGSPQKYVLLLPNGWEPTQDVALVVALHGHGSDRWQFVRDPRDECRAVREAAAEHRMLLVAPDYRARTSWMGPAAEADVLQIIDSLKSRFPVRQVILCGGSMGGAGALTFAALHPDKVGGVVAFNGSANLAEVERFQEAIGQSFGGSRETAGDEFRKRSAEFFPKRLTMPLAATTGGKDESVPPDSVLRLAASLKELGRPVLSLHRPQGGHSTTYGDAKRAVEFVVARAAASTSAKLLVWMRPQRWTRDLDRPVLSLGSNGSFDDTHIFAPAVIRNDGSHFLYYCGSQGEVSKRVFRLGLATSVDGVKFIRSERSPVFEFGDGKRSVLTPAFLRRHDGQLLRDDGKLRMWFSSTDFQDKSGLHTLHETTSRDGVNWTPPSPSLLSHVYAPTVLRDGAAYRMWYVDVERNPWTIRHAESKDGRSWTPDKQACLAVDQAWEKDRLFYPTVRKLNGAYVMWYGSYWSARRSTTALGFAVSLDGKHWQKYAENPVHRPDPKREWESNYVTSQSVLTESDGSLVMWYASRKKPPFKNKYFAINSATWKSTPISTSRAKDERPTR